MCDVREKFFSVGEEAILLLLVQLPLEFATFVVVDVARAEDSEAYYYNE